MTKPSLNPPKFPTLARRVSFRLLHSRWHGYAYSRAETTNGSSRPDLRLLCAAHVTHASKAGSHFLSATSHGCLSLRSETTPRCARHGFTSTFRRPILLRLILSLTLTMTLASCHVSKQATSVSTGELNTMATTEATASRLHLDSVAAAFAVMFDSLEIEMVFPVAPVNVAPAETDATYPVATTLCPDGSPLSFGMGVFTSFGGEGNPSLTSRQPSFGTATIRISAAHAAATTAQSVSSLDVFATHTSDSLRSQSSTRTETAESSSATRMAKPINTTAIIIVLIALAAAAFLLRYLYVKRHFPK